MNPNINRIFYFAAMLVIAGLFLHISGISFAYMIFIAGAIIFSAMRIISGVNDRNRKFSRIPMIQFVSAISLLVSAYLMYKGSNSWSVFVLITAVLEIYAALRQGKSGQSL